MCIKVNKCMKMLIYAPCKSHFFLLKHKTVASVLEEKSELR